MINFSGYSRAAIEKQMLQQVPKSIDTREGSLIQTAISPVAWYLEGLYMLLNQIQQNAYADTARGEYLDYICAERGVSRKAAVSAVRRGVFNVRIPEGAAFKTINGGDSLIFISGALLSEGESRYEYKLTCNTPGECGNAYVGNLLPITVISGLATAVIGEVIITGSDEEEDDSLRARYLSTFETANFGGNIAAYRNEILAISGVGAVQIYPAWQGGGTVLCSILNEHLKPADYALVDQVQEIICPPDSSGRPSANGYGMAPIGAAVTVMTATNLTLNISCKIQFALNVLSGIETYRELIEARIQEYLDTVCLLWGNPLKSQKIEYAVAIYISRISAAILTIPAIVNVTDVTINGSSEDLILIETAELQQIPSLGVVTINGD